jgi:hypothetical protein
LIAACERTAKEPFEHQPRVDLLAIGVVAFFHEIAGIGTAIAAVAASGVAAAVNAELQRRQRVRWPSRRRPDRRSADADVRTEVFTDVAEARLERA